MMNNNKGGFLKSFLIEIISVGTTDKGDIKKEIKIDRISILYYTIL